MSTQVAQGALNVTTAGAGSTIAVTGVGFSPDAIILFYNGKNSNNSNGLGIHRRGIGFACRNGAGVDNKGSGCYDTDGGANTDTGGWNASTRSVKRLTTGLVNGGEGHVSSLDADGFTFTIDTAFGAAFRVDFLAIGGTDVSAVGVGNFTLPTSTGNFSVTGVGGKPDAVFLIGVRNTATSSAIHDFSLSFGAATRFDGGQAVWAGGADHGAATSATLSVGGRGAIYQLFNSNVSGNQSRGSFVSFDSDGFTLNALQGTVADQFIYLAITGPAFKIGGIDTPTDTTTTVKEDGIGFVPNGFLFVGHENGESTFTSPTGDDMWSMAAATSPSSRAVLGTESFNGASGGSVVLAEYDGIYLDLSSAPAVEIRTDLTAVGRNDFSFKNLTNTTGGSGFIWYVAIGDAPGDVIDSSRGNVIVTGGPSGTILASSRGQFSVVASEGISGTSLVDSSRGTVQSAGTPGATGAILDTSRGTLQSAGTPGATGAPLDTSRGDLQSAGTPGATGAILGGSRGDLQSAGGVGSGGAILQSSRGDLFVAGSVQMAGDFLDSSRGDFFVSATPAIPGDAIISSRGDFLVDATPAYAGQVILSSRGNGISSVDSEGRYNTPGIGGDFLDSSRGTFFSSSGSDLASSVYFSGGNGYPVANATPGIGGAVLDPSRGDGVVGPDSVGIGGAVLASSRGNFYVTGSGALDNPFACRPGSVTREYRRGIIDKPYPWIRFRARHNRP